MASSEWEEVKRLAADFQRAQLSSTAAKLSERNCIEIVTKLIESKSLDVIYTNDGKEYLTPSQLSKEISDELIVHGGRINLVDLQQIINVDLTHVELKANELVKNDRNLNLILGQLVNTEYLERLAEEINDLLQESGQVSIAELAKTYDLPGEYLTELVESELGRRINGQMDAYDRGVVFTSAFVAKHSSQICGVFSAVTRPVQVHNVLTEFGFQEKLFYTVLNELIKKGRLRGSFVGGKQDKATYVPDMYSKTQNNWIDAFYKQNGYFEYDTLSRLGLTDAKGYIKTRFKSENLLFLSSSCAGSGILDQVQASIEEALDTGTWIDVEPLLPSCFSPTDTNQIVNQVLKSKSGAKVFCNSIVASDRFIGDCKELFQKPMLDRANTTAKKSPNIFLQVDRKALGSGENEGKRDKKEDKRRKVGGGGGGGGSKGGMGGREVKIRKVKKHYRVKEVEEEEDDLSGGLRPTEIPFMTVEQVKNLLHDQSSLSECPEEFIEELSQHLHRPLTTEYQDALKAAIGSLSGSTDSTSRRKNHEEMQEKINGLLTSVKMFEKNITIFEDELRNHLVKYLLRTLCTEIANLLFSYVAAENSLVNVEHNDVTPEVRLKILTKLPDKVKPQFTKLNASLNDKSLDDFSKSLESAADVCDVMLKKVDKKKERNIIFNHKQALIAQLKEESDPAMALHLAVVLLIQNTNNTCVHAPGRCIPQLLVFLESHIAASQYKLLSDYMGLVQKQLGALKKTTEESHVEDGSEKTDSQKDAGEVATSLIELLPQIKEIALAKKTSTAESAKPDG
ncbi:E3 UFM1-protein ligase 1-like [Anneissia japonica]|uniref:E3 UFM1-protein ligase 1-like n=1 Tax=Anneissia japonica TaxID=1529436 RepID=UPI001425AAA2|nr:E3 UFM1-protein ligase 1-like [Anneissia japonica]